MDEQQVINTIKGLILDGPYAAKSGHPGGAMSSLDFAYVLFTEFLNFDPDNPNWLGRDRFILSAGHESMLLYSLLHMVGWLSVDDLKNFRQLHSKTPGHPENYLTPGVECTTGPLGQGAAMSVGFASASLHFKHRLDDLLFDYRTYALLGDGCMQEDVTLGAASLAGHLRLDNLIWFYDKNRAQISGRIERSTSDDEAGIFRGFGWNVIQIDGHDRLAIRKALMTARDYNGSPTLIIGDTQIAKGAHSMEGNHGTHGAPLPEAEHRATKRKLGLDADQSFYCPEEAIRSFRSHFDNKRATVKKWQERLTEKLESNLEFRKYFDFCFEKETFSHLPTKEWPADKPVATRNAFGDLLELWAMELPNLFGGSADLEPSNMTGAFAKKVGDFQADNRLGRNLSFGVREFPMSAFCNGVALHGGLIPFDATFLTFSDYSRPALRLGAIQRVRVIHEFSHDSFYLGEDGPTHQAIEHVMSLRLIPDFYVMRPADAHETEALLRKALELPKQSALCLSRQKLPILPIERSVKNDAIKGAYVVRDAQEGKAEFVIFATGSEVSLALDVADTLGPRARVVSVPSWELFFDQPSDYQEQILDWSIAKRVSIEAGVTLGWHKFTGHTGLNIGVDHFGDSAPAHELAKEYGFAAEAICAKIQSHFE